MKKIYNKVKGTVTTLAFAIATLVSFTQLTYAGDKFSEASKSAATGIQTSAQGAAKWLLMIVLVVCGLALAFGSARHKEAVKDKAPWVLIGIALIIGASAIAAIIFAWF